MSLQVFKHKFGHYLQDFPESLYFRVQFIQHHFLYNKDFFYFGSSLGEMRHGTYGICFKIQNNGNLIVYEGAWQKDQYNGKGSMFLISSPKIKGKQFFRWTEGTWKNGRLQGKGSIKEYCHEQKCWDVKYAGEFQNSHKHGYGIQTFNGNRYQGHFINGCKHGQGRLIDDQGNFYDGNFQEGFPKGQGLQLKGGTICVKDKSQNSLIYDKPSASELPGFIAKTIKNI